MSYEIIKRITFNEKTKDVSICGESSNCTPKLYNSVFHPLRSGSDVDYEGFKRYFAESLFDGSAEFQPSCKSKAKVAYDRANKAFNVALTPYSTHPLYHAAQRQFPHIRRYNPGSGCFEYEPEDMRAAYESFRDAWCDCFVEELNNLLVIQKQTA